jgi:hypothetical protein
LTLTVGQLPNEKIPPLRLVASNPDCAKSFSSSKVAVATTAFFSTEFALKGVLSTVAELFSFLQAWINNKVITVKRELKYNILRFIFKWVEC